MVQVLKSGYHVSCQSKWFRTLSTVLLGLRSDVMDTGSSPTEYVYGTTLRMSGEFVLPEDETPTPQLFLEEFRQHMREIKPVPVGQKYKKCVFLHKDLASCSHIFLKVGHKKALERPYSGSHKVIERVSDRVFKIDVNGQVRNVSVENLKPAYFIREDLVDTFQPSTSPIYNHLLLQLQHPAI